MTRAVVGHKAKVRTGNVLGRRLFVPLLVCMTDCEPAHVVRLNYSAKPKEDEGS